MRSLPLVLHTSSPNARTSLNSASRFQPFRKLQVYVRSTLGASHHIPRLTALAPSAAGYSQVLSDPRLSFAHIRIFSRVVALTRSCMARSVSQVISRRARPSPWLPGRFGTRPWACEHSSLSISTSSSSTGTPGVAAARGHLMVSIGPNLHLLQQRSSISFPITAGVQDPTGASSVLVCTLHRSHRGA